MCFSNLFPPLLRGRIKVGVRRTLYLLSFYLFVNFLFKCFIKKGFLNNLQYRKYKR